MTHIPVSTATTVDKETNVPPSTTPNADNVTNDHIIKKSDQNNANVISADIINHIQSGSNEKSPSIQNKSSETVKNNFGKKRSPRPLSILILQKKTRQSSSNLSITYHKSNKS